MLSPFRPNDVRKNSASNKIYHDIEMTLQYDHFSYVDRLFLESTDEFINHGRAYFFELMDEANTGIPSFLFLAN